jgi:hypothetical protein
MRISLVKSRGARICLLAMRHPSKDSLRHVRPLTDLLGHRSVALSAHRLDIELLHQTRVKAAHRDTAQWSR